MVARYPKTVSPEEYLEQEEQSEFKSEFIDGEIIAMSGGSIDHSAIASNVEIALGLRLRGTSCRTLNSNMMVNVEDTDLYLYPDVSVLCGKPLFKAGQRDILLNPTIVIEVLSPSTEAHDRGKKFFYYRQIESLTDYILVEQDRPLVEHFVRQPNGFWQLSQAVGLDSTLEIASLDLTLPLTEIYDRVELPE